MFWYLTPKLIQDFLAGNLIDLSCMNGE